MKRRFLLPAAVQLRSGPADQAKLFSAVELWRHCETAGVWNDDRQIRRSIRYNTPTKR